VNGTIVEGIHREGKDQESTSEQAIVQERSSNSSVSLRNGHKDEAGN
jgi:hypothetical protein